MISRRDFLKNTITGLAALVLSENSPSQAQQPQFNPNDYSIGYEEWKEACKNYKEASRAGDNEKKALFEKFRNSILFTKLDNVYNEPRRAYDLLSDEDKIGVNKTYEEHQKSINNKNRKPNDVGDVLVSPIVEGILLPLETATMVMSSRNRKIMKDFYGKDIDLDKRKLLLQEYMLVYLDKKFELQYSKECERERKEKEAKMTPEEREREKNKGPAELIFDFLFR